MLAAVVTAFVAFTGIATLVPGGLAEPGGAAAGGTTLTEGWLVVLALNDALVALVLGYRLAVLRYGTVRDAARSAATFAIVVAVAAGAVRAIDLPRLVGPGGADAGVLPLGRAPRARRRSAAASRGSCGRRSCSWSSRSSSSPGTCACEPDPRALGPEAPAV